MLHLARHLRPGGLIAIIDDFLNEASPLVGAGETAEIRGVAGGVRVAQD